ncbi:type II secretion system protein GspL [Achromobacter xylosoxidans]
MRCARARSGCDRPRRAALPSWRACTGARVTAFVQPGDMALAAALLPPLTPARLKVAAAGAVELLALGDADALLVAHGARAADGNVCLAWIAREQAERAQALMEGCGLTAAALAPLPLWLPRTPDGWTLMQGDDWVALRAGSDHVEIHAIARADVPSGDVSRADTGAMDSVGGHAAGADKPGVGASGAYIPGVQALLRALETARPARIVWIGGIPPWWPHDMPAEQGREIEAGADVAPGWNVALARRASAVAGSWRGAIKWAAIAATVWIGGLQLQAWRLEHGVAELRAHVHDRVQQAFPALARVTDPLRRSASSCKAVPGNRSSRSCWARPPSIWPSPPAKWPACAMRTARWMWRWRPARAVTRRRKGHAGLDQGGGQGRRIRRAASRRLAPAPRAAAGRGTREPLMSFAFRPLAAAPFAAGRKRIADWRARAGNYWLGLAPRERRMLAGCALLALAALCWLALIEPALARAERARRTDAPARFEHRAGNIAGQRASRASRARPGDGSVAAPWPGADRFAGRRDGARPGWPLAPEPGGRAGRTLAALAADAAWASVAATGPDRLAPHRCARRRRVQAYRHGAGSTGQGRRVANRDVASGSVPRIDRVVPATRNER